MKALRKSYSVTLIYIFKVKIANSRLAILADLLPLVELLFFSKRMFKKRTTNVSLVIGKNERHLICKAILI